MQAEWEIRRSKFNHDWLQNRFLNALGAFLVRLSQRKLNIARLEKFVATDFPTWAKFENEAWWLIDSFEVEMSPKRFFTVAPLNRCDAATMDWLPDVVHNLWLARYPVADLQEEGRSILRNLGTQAGKLISDTQKRDWSDPDFVIRIREQFDSFRVGAERLSAILGSMREQVKPL